MKTREVFLSFLEKYETVTAPQMVEWTGMSLAASHSMLNRLMQDGYVGVDTRTRPAKWSYIGDDLPITQIWSEYKPSNVKHNHELMNCWY